MGDYIERQLAVDAIQDTLIDTECPEYVQRSADEKLYKIPAADVRPVVHGKWNPTEYPIMPECEDCSVCGYRAVYGHNYNFCPECGSDMR